MAPHKGRESVSLQRDPGRQHFYLLCTCSNKRKHRSTKHFIWLNFDSPQGDERINNIPQLQSNLRHKAGRIVLKAKHCKANKVKCILNLVLFWRVLKTGEKGIAYSIGLYNKFQTKNPAHLTSTDNYVMPHRKEMLFLNPSWHSSHAPRQDSW